MPIIRQIVSLAAVASLLLAPNISLAAAADAVAVGSVPHPRPIVRGEESLFSGVIPLEDGSVFRVFPQTINGVKIWRFEVGEAYWWVSPIGVIWGRGTHSRGSPEAAIEAGSDEEAYERYVSML